MKEELELTIWGAIKLVLLYIFLGIIIGIGSYLIQLVINKLYGNFGVVQWSSYFFTFIEQVLIIWLIYSRIRKRKCKAFKFRMIGDINYKNIIIVVLLAISFRMWYHNSIYILISEMPVPEFIEKAFERILGNPYIAILMTVIIAPVFEELLFRGVFLEGFLNTYRFRKGIILSSVMFGIFHMNLPQFITAFILGIIVGIIYYKTRSLILCIIFHLINNGTVVLELFTKFNIDGIAYFITGVIIFVTVGILFSRNTSAWNIKKNMS